MQAASKPSESLQMAKKATSAAPQATQPSDLPPEVVLLIAKAIAPKRAGDARSKLRAGNHDLDVTVRVRGSITIAPDTPAGVGQSPAPVSVWGTAFISSVLKRCGVGPKKLHAVASELCEAALTSGRQFLSDDAFEAQPDLIGTLNGLAYEIQAKLKPVTYTTAAKSGSVTALAEVELIESRDVFPRIAPGTDRERPSKSKAATKKAATKKKRA